MAKERGWWKLTLSMVEHDDLTDADLEHIGSCIVDGYIEGEIVKDGD